MTKQFGLVTKDDYNNNIYCNDKPLWPFLDYYFKPISLFWIIVMTKMSLWQLRPSQGEGGGYLCPQCEFQICSFHILRSKVMSLSNVKPSACFCCPFIQSCIAISRPCCLSEFYSTRASNSIKQSQLSLIIHNIIAIMTLFYYSKQISSAVLQS